MLSMDYWEGFYASGSDTIVECTDMCQSTLGYTVYGITTGKVLKTGSMQYTDGTTFSSLNSEIKDVCPTGLTLRLSDAVETPDRHAEIQRILSEGDRFQLFRIRDLVRRLLTKGIVFFGGPIGGSDLYDAGYEGFYLLADGMKKGPELGSVLQALLDEVLEDPARNRKEYLLERSRSLRA